MRIQIETDVRLNDESKLRAFYVEREYGEDGDELSDVLLDTVVDPGKPPLDFGCEIVDKVAIDLKDGTWRLRLVVDVSSEDKIVAEAVAAYRREWADEMPLSDQSSLCSTVYEIMIGSNPNPSPFELGYEVLGYEKVRDRAIGRRVPGL